MRIEQRKILITGGGSGIGLVLARSLARENDVVVAGRDFGKLERATAGKPNLRATQLDVASEESARAAVAWTVQQLGGLDLLVNSAGVLRQVPFESAASEHAAEEEVATNLTGSLRMTRLTLPHLRRSDDGAVVFISSALALAASPGLAVYAATKAAIHSAARSLRAELGTEVKVFDVLPPFVDTALAHGVGREKLTPQQVVDEIVRGLRQNRFEIRIGRVSALAALSRLMPSVADAIIAREIGDLPAETGSRPS
jgi:uncharacterized oxidoreductase